MYAFMHICMRNKSDLVACVCAYIYIYIYICICIYVYIYDMIPEILLFTKSMYVYICMYVCTYVYAFAGESFYILA